ncbi:hypothetical protein [Thalassoglobus polymorphus]|nr:hypothetical protein [Thalassoglobus polymorphus]
MATWMKDLPSFMFAPPISPAAIFTDFPPDYVYDFIKLGTLATSLLLLGGILPKSTSILLSFLLFGIRIFAYASGKINHDILVPLIPAVLAFSNWGNAFRIHTQTDLSEKKKLNDGLPVAIFAFLTAFWMATAGWQKITTDWLNLGYSVVQSDCFNNFNVTGRRSAVGQLALNCLRPWMWELLDWTTVVFELSGIFVVWKRSAFRYWLFVATFFHLGIDLVMLIPYAPAIIAYGVFVPWHQLVGKSRVFEKLQNHTVIIPAALVITFGLVKLVLPSIPFLNVSRLIVWSAPIIACCLVTQHSQKASASTDDIHVDG